MDNVSLKVDFWLDENNNTNIEVRLPRDINPQDAALLFHRINSGELSKQCIEALTKMSIENPDMLTKIQTIMSIWGSLGSLKKTRKKPKFIRPRDVLKRRPND